MKRVCAILMLSLLGSCGPTSGIIAVLIVAPLGEQMSQFGFQVVEMPRLINISKLEGERFVFTGGPNIPRMTYAETYTEENSFVDARASLWRKVPSSSVYLNLSWNGQYYAAADFDSLYMLSAYYQFEKVADFLVNVVGDKSAATTTPAVVGVYGSFTSRGIFRIPSGFVDNSAYLPLGDVFKMYRVADQEGLPFEMNPGVVAHEFHHRIFHHQVFESRGKRGFEIWKSLNDASITTKSARVRVLLRATDEGLADILAIGFTRNIDFLSASRSQSEGLEFVNHRSLEGPFASAATYENLANGLMERKFVAACHGDSLNFTNPNWQYYCLGTVIAKTLWDGSQQDINVLREEILPAINQALPALSNQLLNDFESYDIDVLWRAVLDKLRVERAALLCLQIKNRFASLYARIPQCAL